MFPVLSAGGPAALASGHGPVAAEAAIADRSADDFDALVVPGGFAPDKLRRDDHVLDLVRRFDEAGKPVAAICHAPWMLIEAGVVQGRTVPSWPSLQTDIRNAGGNWVDEEVVTDQGLVTSRHPDDLPAFWDKIVDEVDEGTAFFKATAARGDLPTQGTFLSLDADGDNLPSDWYLKLAGAASRALRRELVTSPQVAVARRREALTGQNAD